MCRGSIFMSKARCLLFHLLITRLLRIKRVSSLKIKLLCMIFFFSSRRRHTRLQGDWSSDVCSSDLLPPWPPAARTLAGRALRRGPAQLHRGTRGARCAGFPARGGGAAGLGALAGGQHPSAAAAGRPARRRSCLGQRADRKSTRLNSSHLVISYAVFCLKKKKKKTEPHSHHCPTSRTH